ncbi:MAG: HD domain-containing protein [Candidatus Omnitrophica bacterium]|nr:HD domain-containing protein [Candidatus Omnitrophota bacterium]
MTGLRDLIQAARFKRLKEILIRGVQAPIWWEIPSAAPKSLEYSAACRTCRFVRASAGNRRTCQNRFLKALETARARKDSYAFICPIQRHAVCLPVVSEGEVQGYVALCNHLNAFPRETLQWAPLALETVLAEAERRQELKNLSEAIQPRCIALSTVHTIHRLISSTLNLEELLPRVARLTCQVLRARSCEIWFVDPSKKRLQPQAKVDAVKPAALKGEPIRMGQGRVGRVASTARLWVSREEIVVPLVEEEVMGVIRVRGKLKGSFGSLDQEILTTLAEQAVVAIRNAQMYERQEKITWGTIKSLSAILDGMDTHAPHGVSNPKVLSEVALAIGRKLRLSESQEGPLQYAAWLHDAGRVGIPQEILKKTEKLAPEEFAKIREHPVKGAHFLQSIEILEPAIPIILHHHERYDGTGYPKGLAKEGIPLGARILAVANAFEAMVSERPYRKAMSVGQAAQEIAAHAGTQFDPQVVEGFLELVRSGAVQEILKKRP